MSPTPEAWRRAGGGAAALAAATAVLLAIAARDRTAPLAATAPAPYLLVLAAAALGAGLALAPDGPLAWRRRGALAAVACGALGGALGAAAGALALRLVDLTDTGIPALLLHGGAVLGPLAAARLVPVPGAAALGLLVAHAAAWALGSATSSYPALALAQLPLIVGPAEAWLGLRDRGATRAPRGLAVAGALLGLGSTAAAYLLVPGSERATAWLGRLIRDVMGGVVAGALIGRLPLPGRLARWAREGADDEDLHPDG